MTCPFPTPEFLTVTVPTSLTPVSSGSMSTSMSSLQPMNVPVPSDTLKYPLEERMRTCSADMGEAGFSFTRMLVSME